MVTQAKVKRVLVALSNSERCGKPGLVRASKGGRLD